MKKVLLFIGICLCAIGAWAQGFEGTIRWSMTMEITDPKLKAEMETAQQQLNDPETKEQLKELQERMKDPEMIKMMESNPQMKAAMEVAMKSAVRGGGPENMQDMMPRGMMLKIKGNNMVSTMEGGMANGMEVLHVKDKPVTRVNRAEKTYSKMPESGGQPAKAKVTKTTESMKVLGYPCTKYVVEVTEQGTTMQQVFWCTTAIKDINMKALARQKMGQGKGSMYYDEMEGVALKIEMGSSQGMMIMEAKEIKRGKVNDADFIIPADFKEVKMPGGY
ncbi:MAG: DUF4412 domain-containing protein [Cytophagales bacterium]|nr:DUF4412 domain-containing protein [Cytophagales bacterium]